MNEMAAQTLADTIAAETQLDVSIEPSALQPGFWVVIESMMPIRIIKSWIEWHVRKQEILEHAKSYSSV